MIRWLAILSLLILPACQPDECTIRAQQLCLDSYWACMAEDVSYPEHCTDQYCYCLELFNCVETCAWEQVCKT